MADELPLPQRLLNGARVLGKLWKAGERCANDWAGLCTDAADSRKRFCRAKLQWLTLAVGDPERDLSGVEEEYGLILVMKASEFDATGLTMKLDSGILIGPTGGLSAADAGKLGEDPSSLQSILKILQTFPKARVTQV